MPAPASNPKTDRAPCTTKAPDKTLHKACPSPRVKLNEIPSDATVAPINAMRHATCLRSHPPPLPAAAHLADAAGTAQTLAIRCGCGR